MGMSASQARLLFISSRMNDVEFKSQQIANQKIRLSSESEQLANDYAKSLNKETLKMNIVSDVKGGQAQVDLNYKNLIANGYSIRKVNGAPISTIQKNEPGQYKSLSELSDAQLAENGITKEVNEKNVIELNKNLLTKVLDAGNYDKSIEKIDELIEGLKNLDSNTITTAQFQSISMNGGYNIYNAARGENLTGDGLSYQKKDDRKILIQQLEYEKQAIELKKNGESNNTIYEKIKQQQIDDNTTYKKGGKVLSEIDQAQIIENYNQKLGEDTIIENDKDLIKAFQENPDYLIQGLLSGIFVLEAPNEETGKNEQVSLSSDPNFDIKHDSSQDAKAE
ncbi:MAG: hypothetical protein ACI37S_06645, partial [Candidatus Gastranaerophilaceae bacterium]